MYDSFKTKSVVHVVINNSYNINKGFNDCHFLGGVEEVPNK